MTINTIAAFSGCTTTIHHPAHIAGLREAIDDSAGVRVRAFPFGGIARVGGLLSYPGVYALCGRAEAYIGESTNLGRRLLEHAADPAKAFATEVFAMTTVEPWLDKPSLLYLQKQLTEQAEAARHVTIVKGAAPSSVDLPGYRVATLNRLLQDGYRLLFDAGCRAFHSCDPAKDAAEMNRAAFDADEADDPGFLEIGVSSVPPGAQEYELLYTGTWALGYQHEDRFVVAAGSEVRETINPSVNPILHARRARLKAANALMAISGVADRMRLAVAVAFPSMAIAAKVVCGAHVNARLWRPVQRPAAVILAPGAAQC
jgi:hypothetical protein